MVARQSERTIYKTEVRKHTHTHTHYEDTLTQRI